MCQEFSVHLSPWDGPLVPCLLCAQGFLHLWSGLRGGSWKGTGEEQGGSLGQPVGWVGESISCLSASHRPPIPTNHWSATWHLQLPWNNNKLARLADLKPSFALSTQSAAANPPGAGGLGVTVPPWVMEEEVGRGERIWSPQERKSGLGEPLLTKPQD